MSLIPLPPSLVPFLEPFLPVNDEVFITLTYAQSLDSRISSKPGVQTKISHLETKTMTHYLRSKHDGILVGIGTVLADDPKLNCRYEGVNSPVPIVLDPHGKWVYHKSQLRKICDGNQGKPPVIIIDEDSQLDDESVKVLAQQGGKILQLPLKQPNNWNIIIDALSQQGIKSIMIEGGARIINDLLIYKKDNKSIVNSLIITIGPVFLGNEGVEVSPLKHVSLSHVKWWSGIQDSIMCATIE